MIVHKTKKKKKRKKKNRRENLKKRKVRVVTFCSERVYVHFWKYDPKALKGEEFEFTWNAYEFASLLV